MAEERGAWTVFGERLVYDNRWVKLGLADVQAPNGERWESVGMLSERGRSGAVLPTGGRPSQDALVLFPRSCLRVVAMF